jgi:hypothetical protein
MGDEAAGVLPGRTRRAGFVTASVGSEHEEGTVERKKRRKRRKQRKRGNWGLACRFDDATILVAFYARIDWSSGLFSLNR